MLQRSVSVLSPAKARSLHSATISNSSRVSLAALIWSSDASRFSQNLFSLWSSFRLFRAAARTEGEMLTAVQVLDKRRNMMEVEVEGELPQVILISRRRVLSCSLYLVTPSSVLARGAVMLWSLSQGLCCWMGILQVEMIFLLFLKNNSCRLLIVSYSRLI